MAERRGAAAGKEFKFEKQVTVNLYPKSIVAFNDPYFKHTLFSFLLDSCLCAKVELLLAMLDRSLFQTVFCNCHNNSPLGVMELDADPTLRHVLERTEPVGLAASAGAEVGTAAALVLRVGLCAHGGASVVLAETLGSVGSHFLVKDDGKAAVGIEVNANHLKSIRKGWVYGEANIVHRGGKLHVWSIDIKNEAGDLICTSRLTVMIIKA